MTRVLRQGLYEILTGQKNDMDSDLSQGQHSSQVSRRYFVDQFAWRKL
ncbi:MAG: hypothetical protein U0930_25955 [Pirellulales bacterium]